MRIVAYIFLSDSSLKLWIGCYASKSDLMVVMACPAINGYHSIATYSWQRNGNLLKGEETPLLYCSEVGTFTCHVTAGDIISSQEFIVSGRFVY